MSLLDKLDKYTLEKIYKVLHQLKMKDVNDEFTDIIFFTQECEIIDFVQHKKSRYIKVYINDYDACERGIKNKLKISYVIENIFNSLWFLNEEEECV